MMYDDSVVPAAPRLVELMENDDLDMDAAPLEDIDPDVNLFSSLNSNFDCKYYDDSQFHDAYSLYKRQCSFLLSIMHCNVRSISKHFDDFTEYLQSLDKTFSVIGLSETWSSKEKCDLYNIEGYSKVDVCRQDDRRGGGVCLYIHNALDFKVRYDLEFSVESFESCFAELSSKSVGTSCNLVVGVVYRPPNTDSNEFMLNMLNVLDKLKTDKKTCFIMGDFNVNITDTTSHIVNDFLNLMHSHLFMPLIQQPTRVTETSATLIDNIFTNCIGLSVKSGILCTDISDHMPVFCLMKCNYSVDNNGNSSVYRVINEENIALFKARLMSVDWSVVYAEQCTQSAYSLFQRILLDAYNVFPLRQSRPTRKASKPWLTTGLKESIHRKNKLYKLSVKRPTELNVLRYKIYRKALIKVLRKAEKDYYHTKLTELKNNLRKTWDVLKKLCGIKFKQKCQNEFKINNDITSTPIEIANGFNECFINLGQDLAEKIPHVNKKATDYLRHRIPHSFFCEPATESEVLSMFKQMKCTSAGWDTMAPRVIKSVSDVISAPLTHVLNLSLTQGIVPFELKIARVTPIYKSGDNQLCINYRPVSVLTCLSKIFERCMYNRLFKFLESNNVLNDCQFGFRKDSSPELALSLLVERITRALDAKENAVGLFIDLSKAFDTVNFKILLQKLEIYGIRGTPLKWVKNYLNGRKQFVHYNDSDSEYREVKCGVPQGSILGPLFFLVYINDLLFLNNSMHFVMFADDTTIIMTDKNINTLQQRINLEMEKVSEWFKANQLSLNKNKSHVMLFTNQKKTNNHNNFIVNIDNIPLRLTDQTTFLGVVLDCRLKWDIHVDKIASKVSKFIGIIKKVKSKLNFSSLLTLYNSFVNVHLSYCIAVWGSTAHVYLEKLFKLQKRALRHVFNVHYREHTAPLFLQAKVLNVYEMYSYNVCIFMYRVFKNNALPSITNCFQIRQHMVDVNIRNLNVFHLKYCRTETRKKNIFYVGPSKFNMLTRQFPYVSQINSLLLFKKKLKSFILHDVIF